MALSVLNLGLQQTMILIDKTDLKGYADFLINGPWMLDHLETIARAKVSTLRLVDEIEVYLGYPVKLRDRLNLQIDVKDMIWFSCSEITQQDLDNAACYTEEQISTPDAIANILAQREDWVQALRTMHKEEISTFESTKLSKLDALKESDVESYKKIQEEYIDNILYLTKNILTS
ncbi:MAG: hypothetical protein FJZ57_00615 [Chlamydiae bacterium]|nr:hypothetical protein [Chlamydiota bacterium]